MPERVVSLLIRSFLRPWQDRTRAFLMIAFLPGLCAAGLQELALSYNVAAFGLWEATLFHVSRMILLAYLVMPLSFRLLESRLGIAAMLLLQTGGAALFLYDPSNGLLNGLACVLCSGPFWAVFSQRGSRALSHENRGHEIALLNFLQTIVIAGGSFSGGWLLKAGLYNLALLSSGFGLVLSTLLCARPIPKEPRLKDAFRAIDIQKPTTRLSLGLAALYALANNGLPTWMKLIGLSPLSAGLAMALRPLLGLVLTPVAGALVQKGGLGAGFIGGLAIMAGWGFLTLAPHWPWLLLPAQACLAAGAGLIAPMEINRWFKRRTNAAILAREWILGAGRTVVMAAAIPLAFLTPTLFPLLGFGVGLAFVKGSRKKGTKR